MPRIRQTSRAGHGANGEGVVPVPGAKRVCSAAELMRLNLPEPVCVVKGLVTEGLNLLASRPKIGKSWMGLQAGIAIARGETAFGSLAVMEGDVLYLALEDNRRRLKRRLMALLDGNSAPERLLLATEWPRIDQGGIDLMAEWIEGAEEPRLIVVDTLARLRSRTSSQADRYADDYKDVGKLQALANEHGIAILGIHHVRKAIAHDYMDDVTGTIGISAAADTVLILRRDRGKADAVLHVTGRDIDEQEVALGWDPERCRWTYLGDAKEARMSDARKRVLECVRENGPIGPRKISQLLDQKENNIKQLLFKLKLAGEVSADEQGQYVVVTPVTDNLDNLVVIDVGATRVD